MIRYMAWHGTDDALRVATMGLEWHLCLVRASFARKPLGACLAGMNEGTEYQIKSVSTESGITSKAPSTASRGWIWSVGDGPVGDPWERQSFAWWGYPWDLGKSADCSSFPHFSQMSIFSLKRMGFQCPLYLHPNQEHCNGSTCTCFSHQRGLFCSNFTPSLAELAWGRHQAASQKLLFLH